MAKTPRERGPRSETEEVGPGKARTVAVIGLSEQGFSLARLAIERGFRVTGFDPDEVRIAQLRDTGEAPNIFTSDPAQLSSASIFILAVDAPLKQKRSADLSLLEQACSIVAPHLREDSLVVIETPVPIGACENIALPILIKGSRLGADQFCFAHCPAYESSRPLSERARVFGGRNDTSRDRVHEFYHTLLSSDLFPMRSIKETEAVPLLLRAYREINTALANELSIVFDKIGVDIINVIEAAAADTSFAPHYPSLGTLSRIPADPFYLIRFGRDKGFEHQLMTAARRVNSRMPHYAIRILENALDELGIRSEGVRITLLGLTASPDSLSLQESSALELRDELLKRGAQITVFDPFAGAYSEASIEAALSGAQVAIIATDHTIFRALTPKIFEAAGIKLVVDGHNRLDRRAFANSSVAYRGIGRG